VTVAAAPCPIRDEATLTDLVTPLIDDFAPTVIIIAAGEDANAFDPNGRMVVSSSPRLAFSQIGANAEMAKKSAQGHKRKKSDRPSHVGC